LKDNILQDDNTIKNMPTGNSYIKIVIEAVVGNGSKSDIAIDDIEITDKSCGKQCA